MFTKRRNKETGERRGETISKYHSGEIEVQQRAGVEDLARRTATVIKPEIPQLAKDFVLEQPMAGGASILLPRPAQRPYHAPALG